MEAYVALEGFSPEEFADVKRCLETLCSIRAGSQPLDRNLGIDYDSIVGYPINVAENMLAVEIIDKINIYEPRAEVSSVTFEHNKNGQLIPHIHVIKREE